MVVNNFISYFDYGVDINPFYDGIFIYTSIMVRKSKYKRAEYLLLKLSTFGI